jgi:Fe2+ transport system protein B
MRLTYSQRIVRLLKNEEEAIATVVAVYRYGCERLLKQMTEAHDANIEYCQEIQQAIEVELVQRCKEVLRKVDQETEDLDPEETKKLAEALEKRAEKLLNKIEAVANEYEVEESE